MGVNEIAERRMFAKTIIDSDAFLEMPMSTQCLYFHLSMRADDDGFINNPKSIMRIIGCKDDDVKILIGKKFIIPFESGVVVIKHWKIHNYIRNDRYKETKYKDEKSTLELDENNAYTQTGIPIDNQMETQVRLGKDRLGKVNIDMVEQVDSPTSKKKFIKPTKEEIEQYCTENNYNVDAEKFIDYYDSNGWIVGKTKMKDWKATVRGWHRREKENKSQKTQPPQVPKSNKFHNFQERDYGDLEEIGKKNLENKLKKLRGE